MADLQGVLESRVAELQSQGKTVEHIRSYVRGWNNPGFKTKVLFDDNLQSSAVQQSGEVEHAHVREALADGAALC